jgi:hypothetical protein
MRGKKILKVVPLPVPYRSDVPRPPFVGEERFEIVELGFLVHPADGSGHRKHYIGARARLIHAVGKRFVQLDFLHLDREGSLRDITSRDS